MGEESAAARPDIAERHREIAGALKKRSRKGLTHRDLKLRESCSLNPTLRTDSVSPAQSPPFLREHGRPELPNKLQSKLDLSRSRGRRGNLTGARNGKAIPVKEGIVGHWGIEIAGIQSVKNLCPELHVERFRDSHYRVVLQ